MKKIVLLILFVVLQTNSYARSCRYVTGYAIYKGPKPCYTQSGGNPICECNNYQEPDISCGSQIKVGQVNTGVYSGVVCVNAGTYGYPTGPIFRATCCDDACLRDSVAGCPVGYVWNSATCQCEPPPPPPCQIFQKCETYWNTGNGMGVTIGPGITAQTDPNYNGPGYYAMRLYEVDTCTIECPPEGCITLLMDVPGTCAEQGYCDPGDNACIIPGGGGSSSSGSSSSSYEPPDCVCLGCFGGSCMVTCSDGSNRTCVGDYDNCTELKNSPEWTQCTAPSSSPSGGSSSGGGGSSASPSSQANTLDGLNALIDTLHHSNELQEVGHGIMREGNEQNKNYFDDVRGFFGGLLSQVKGIFGNTQTIANNTSKTNSLLTDIKNKPRDTTIVNVSGDTNIVNVSGDTNIVNIPIDSAPGLPWDTAASVAGPRGSWDSLVQHLDSMINPDTIHTGPPDSLVRGLYGVLDSGAGRIYRDTIDGLVAQGIANNTLSGQGSNTCPAFIMSSYPITIGPVTFDMTQNVKLGQYLCNPVIGGKSAWDIGRTILRIVVAIGCMFFLFRCATGTLGGEE